MGGFAGLWRHGLVRLRMPSAEAALADGLGSEHLVLMMPPGVAAVMVRTARECTAGQIRGGADKRACLTGPGSC